MGFDTIHGLGGDDILYGDVRVNNAIIKNAGNDHLFGDGGNDNLYGDAQINNATINFAGNDIIEGGSENDNLIGDVGSNSGILSQAGADILLGGLGSDQLFGDVKSGSRAQTGGNDELDGGDGIDFSFYLGKFTDFTFDFVGANGQDASNNVSHNNTTFQVIDTTGHEGMDTLTNIEKLAMSNDYTKAYLIEDIIWGNNVSNTLVGNNGNQILLGFIQDDILYGDGDSFAYNSTTNQSTGRDFLNGGAGIDKIV